VGGQLIVLDQKGKLKKVVLGKAEMLGVASDYSSNWVPSWGGGVGLQRPVKIKRGKGNQVFGGRVDGGRYGVEKYLISQHTTGQKSARDVLFASRGVWFENIREEKAKNESKVSIYN